MLEDFQIPSWRANISEISHDMIWMMYLGLWDLKPHTEPTEWQAKCPKFWHYTKISSKFQTLLGILDVASILCNIYLSIYIYKKLGSRTMSTFMNHKTPILASPRPPMCPVVQLAMPQGKPGHLQQERRIGCYHVHGSKNGPSLGTTLSNKKTCLTLKV